MPPGPRGSHLGALPRRLSSRGRRDSVAGACGRGRRAPSHRGGWGPPRLLEGLGRRDGVRPTAQGPLARGGPTPVRGLRVGARGVPAARTRRAPLRQAPRARPAAPPPATHRCPRPPPASLAGPALRRLCHPRKRFSRHCAARPRGASPRGSPRPGWAVRGRAREPRTPPESPAARPAAPGPRAWLLAPRRAPRPPSRARASRSPGNGALRALTPCFPLGFPAPHYFPPVSRMSLPSTKTHHNTAAEVKMSTD